MKITDIRVINGDQPRCQIPLVEVETDTGLIGIGATQAPGTESDTDWLRFVAYKRRNG